MRENMDLSWRVLGALGTNVYFITNKTTGETLIVDPADRAEYIADQLKTRGQKAAAILLTHGHFDHINAVNSLKDLLGVKVYAHRDEEGVLKDSYNNRSAHWALPIIVTPDVELSDNEEITLAGFRIRVLHTPGHTAGSCCYYFPDEGVLISGDTLFARSYGRTDLPTGSTSSIIRSVRMLLNTLPGETEVYPGHEIPTTIAEERAENPLAER